MSLSSKLSITDVDVKGKRVLIRVSSGPRHDDEGIMSGEERTMSELDTLS